MTREELLQRHDELSASIAASKRTLANLEPEQSRIQTETFLSTPGSDTVRRNAANQASLHVTEQVVRLKREIEAQTIELENVRMQLHYS